MTPDRTIKQRVDDLENRFDQGCLRLHSRIDGLEAQMAEMRSEVTAMREDLRSALAALAA